MSSAGKQKARVDEDVDDLDDILDDFNAPPPLPKPAPAASSATSSTPSKATAPQPEDDALDADFAQEFARQMEDVLRELGGDTGPPPAPGTEDSADEERRRQEALKKAWEAMLIEGMDGASGASAGGSTGPETKGQAAAEDAFQKNIREAMERLKQSDANSQANAASGDDELEKLLAQLGDVGADEGELGGILEGMMGQLMSKDVLYEPLKELHDKFPEYLKVNEGKLNVEDKTRYAAQQKYITQIVAIFEDPAYSDDNAERGAEVVALMSEMQTHGTPPAELMGPLPPGLSLGADGMPKLPEDCIIA
ncbi:Pex19 protein family-domain-containing protein [Amylostereum chailletii]|nr:Pex19 protein family-domain-containing protein [Amylostereum chailletii]